MLKATPKWRDVNSANNQTPASLGVRPVSKMASAAVVPRHQANNSDVQLFITCRGFRLREYLPWQLFLLARGIISWF
jgi:hypothetical protein